MYTQPIPQPQLVVVVGRSRFRLRPPLVLFLYEDHTLPHASV